MTQDPTPSQTVGPFFGFALPFADGPQAAEPGAPGTVRIEGRVVDGAGEPVPDALVEMWQGESFARCGTDSEGVFHFVVPRPGAIPGPDGSVQAPHLNVTVFARGLLRHLVTRMYFPDEEAANEADPVLNRIGDAAARATLVARREGDLLTFDIRLQGDRETVFFAL